MSGVSLSRRAVMAPEIMQINQPLATPLNMVLLSSNGGMLFSQKNGARPRRLCPCPYMICRPVHGVHSFERALTVSFHWWHLRLGGVAASSRVLYIRTTAPRNGHCSQRTSRNHWPLCSVPYRIPKTNASRQPMTLERRRKRPNGMSNMINIYNLQSYLIFLSART